jgi:enoyl-CoA hydratase/carnithine racemase
MPGWGNTQRLVGLFGRPKAIELALTGSQITANDGPPLGKTSEPPFGVSFLGLF